MLSLEEEAIIVAQLCRKHGVSDASIYKWKANLAVWMFPKPSG